MRVLRGRQKRPKADSRGLSVHWPLSFLSHLLYVPYPCIFNQNDSRHLSARRLVEQVPQQGLGVQRPEGQRP